MGPFGPIQINKDQLAAVASVAWSITMPGPMVEEIATRFRYTPFAVAGFAFCRSAINASRFSFSAFSSKLALPIVQWMMPALSTRYVTWPAFAFFTAVATSGVTVPTFGF